MAETRPLTGSMVLNGPKGGWRWPLSTLVWEVAADHISAVAQRLARDGEVVVKTSQQHKGHREGTISVDESLEKKSKGLLEIM